MDYLAKFLAFKKREQTNRRAPPPPPPPLISTSFCTTMHSDAFRITSIISSLAHRSQWSIFALDAVRISEQNQTWLFNFDTG